MIIIVTSLIFSFSLIGFSIFAIRELRKQSAEEAIRFSILAESAFSHIQSKSLRETVEAGALKQSYNLQLETLKDTYAKEKAATKAVEKAKEPVFVKTDDGAEVDLRDYEVLS